MNRLADRCLHPDAHLWSANPGTQECLWCGKTRGQAMTTPSADAELVADDKDVRWLSQLGIDTADDATAGRLQVISSRLALALAENESLRAECGLRQIAGYNKAKDEAATALTLAQERAERLTSALESIRRIPSKPFPDPGAHSWQAYASAMFVAWSDMCRIANAAIAATKEAG